MLNIALLGAGRIGQIHAKNAAESVGARLVGVYDPSREAAERVASRTGAKVLASTEAVLTDRDIHAAIIATPTDTHLDLALALVRAKKAVFCEKPIDLNLERVAQGVKEIEASQTPFFVGFNRRFDPSFAELGQSLANAAIGTLETLTIISRDPSPPPASYVKASGGLFRDMMIHDFDMARFLLGAEPVEVFATASCLVDEAIGREGDVDTAMVVMKTKTGALCHIQNSRRAVYGYDQRIEAFGSAGMLQAGNWRETMVERWTANHVEGAKPPRFFLERYEAAYRREMAHFIEVASGRAVAQVTARDGLRALVLAETALRSLAEKRPIPVP